MSVSLCAESVTKSFPTRGGDLVVLRQVSLTLAAGESAVVMGPSTHLIGRLQQNDYGFVLRTPSLTK